MTDSWQKFIKVTSKDLLATELIFTEMEKGVLTYEGEFEGQVLYCRVSECTVQDYTYSCEESVGSLIQSDYVTLELGRKLILRIA